jgi:uncharacterized protein YaaN involved in tellurite resistance
MSYTREMILARKRELEQAREEARDEFQRLAGAVQLCDAMLAELDASEQPEKGEEKQQ